MKKRLISVLAMCALSVSLFAGCGPSSSSTGSSGDKMTLTILSTKTDFVNTKFKEYAKQYQALHPNITLKFEAYSDYEKTTMTRMSTSDYGDVLFAPSSVKQADYPKYFAPLGTEKDLAKKYYCMDGAGSLFNGTVYTIPSEVNISGVLYNKKVFKDAGITKLPTSTDEFLKDLQTIKDKEKDVIPLYTNYKDQWPLTQWEGDALSISGKASFTNIDLANTDEPFAKGQPLYTLYKLMYDSVKNKLVESDPTTTDWEKSKTMMAQGKIATMMLGSWALVQVQAQAANKDDIGYMPFPSQVNGVTYSELGADYQYAVNKNSKHINEAKELVTWFVEKSSFSNDCGAMNTLKSSKLPEAFSSFKDLGVKFLVAEPAKANQSGWSDKIDKASEVGLWQPDFKQKIIESALGNNSQSLDQIFSGLNAKWKAARAQVVSGQ